MKFYFESPKTKMVVDTNNKTFNRGYYELCFHSSDAIKTSTKKLDLMVVELLADDFRQDKNLVR